jgi:hypothetical protein
MLKGMGSEVKSCFEVSDAPFFLFLGSGAFAFASTFLPPVAGALFAGAFAEVGRAGFFGKGFTGLAGAFLTRVGAGFAFAGVFFGATFFAGTLADGLAALAGTAVFLAGAFTLGFEAATGFLATGFADFFGRSLPVLELDFSVGLEGFATFFATLGLAAGRDGLFEEVVFVFNNLLSVRPGEKAVEHPPHGS